MMQAEADALAVRSIDDLEDSGRHDVERTLRECEQLRPMLLDAGDEVGLQRLRLIEADAATRRGQVEAGARVIREVQTWAEAHGDPYLMTRAHRLMAAVFGKLGDTALGLEHAVAGVHGLQRDWRPTLRADHLRALGQALSFVGSFEEARPRFEDALQLTETADAPTMRRNALNDIAYCEVLAGRGPEAARAADRLLAVIAAQGRRPGYEELDTAAAAYELVGRLAEAELMLSPVLDGEGADTTYSDYDGPAGCLWRLARVQRLRGRLDDARATIAECRARMRDLNSVVALEADREEVELFAEFGDFESAYRALLRYYQEREKLEDAQRMSRAASLKAIFEAEEARRDSAMFREMAERDALTGLRNRRFVDSYLPRMLLDVAERGTILTVGLLDLDHFKLVNDLLSHAVGDEVLRQVAVLIDGAASEVEGGVAARLGGEEFVVILPGLSEAEGVRRLEALRALVAGWDWTPITGTRSVTLSIGCACAPEDDLDASGLLHHADQNLYAAKAAGRNRIVTSPRDVDAVDIAG